MSTGGSVTKGGNRTLSSAKAAKQDEFYTQLSDIANELKHKPRHGMLPIDKQFSPEAYPEYDNYDAIDVGKTADMPADYDRMMGVLDTFLDKCNPDQFEILGSSYTLGTRMSKIAPKGSFLQGCPRFYLAKGDGTCHRQDDRIVIKLNPSLTPAGRNRAVRAA